MLKPSAEFKNMNEKINPIDLRQAEIDPDFFEAALNVLYGEGIRNLNLKNTEDCFSFFVTVVRFYEKLDEIARKQSEDPDEQPDCKVGCSYCCYFDVVVSTLEIQAITHYVRNNFSSKDRYELKKRTRNIKSLIQSRPDEERINIGAPCPFLVENQCSIHGIRPIVCRGYSSPDHNYCKAASKAEIPSKAVIPIIAKTYNLFNALNYAIAVLLMQQYGEFEILLMEEAVDKILENVKKWIKKKLTIKVTEMLSPP